MSTPSSGDHVAGGETSVFGIGKMKSPEPRARAAARRRGRPLRRFGLAQRRAQRRDLAAGGGELLRARVTDVLYSGLLRKERQPLAGDPVALVEHLDRQPLCALRQSTEARRLCRDRAARGLDLARDLRVLACDALLEVNLLEQVLKTACVDHHGDEIRAVTLVAADELLSEHAVHTALGRLELGEPLAGPVGLCAQRQQTVSLCVEVGLDARDLRHLRRRARGELIRPLVCLAHGTRERGHPPLPGADLLAQLTRTRGARDGQDAGEEYRDDDRRHGRHDGAGDTREWRRCAWHWEVGSRRPNGRFSLLRPRRRSP